MHLFFGSRTADGLYDLPSLEKLAAGSRWLTLVPVVSANRPLADVVGQYADWSRQDAYLAGPSRMVTDCAARLAAAGTPSGQIHIEDFGWSEP